MIAAQHLDYPTYLVRLRTMPVENLLKRRPGSRIRTALPRRSCWPWTRWPTMTRPGLCRGLINLIAVLSAAGVSRALLHAAGQACTRDPGAAGGFRPEWLMKRSGGWPAPRC